MKTPDGRNFPKFIDFEKHFWWAEERSIEAARQYLENNLGVKAYVDGKKVWVSKRVSKLKATKLRGFMDGLLHASYDMD